MYLTKNLILQYVEGQNKLPWNSDIPIDWPGGHPGFENHHWPQNIFRLTEGRDQQHQLHTI